MNNRRLLMRKKSVDLKNIKATLTIGTGTHRPYNKHYGYDRYQTTFGEITPNPLPNGVQVQELKAIMSTGGYFYMIPSNMQVTIQGIRIGNAQQSSTLGNYLSSNVGKSIPIILHF